MKNHTKILIATPLYPPQLGGPASRTVLFEHRLPEKGFTISVVKFGSVLGFPKIIRHILYFFMVLFRGLTANIILAQDPVSVGLPSLFASKILMKKFILIIVGDYAWEQGSQRSGVTDFLDAFSVESEKYSFLVRMLKKIQFFVASHADEIIVPSNYLKKIITNWGVNPNKIQVIYNAFHAPDFKGSKEEMRSKFGVNYPMIVTAGRLVPWKGFDTLISLMPEIEKEVSGAKLFVIGDGPDKDYLRDCVKKAKAEKYVELTGKMKQNDLFEHIRAADLFVLNTSYEGMSHQLLEVLYLETPILASDAGGNPEVVDDKKNGVLLKYNDRNAIKEWIIKMLTDKQLASSFAKKGRDKLELFGEERMLSEISDKLRR